MSLRIVPVTLEDANDFVRRFHRHSRPVLGSKFAIGVKKPCGFCEGRGHSQEFMVSTPCPACQQRGGSTDELAGVAIVGRPVARLLDDGLTAEITRVCTDGTRNACSMLYGACRKAAKAMGHERIFTYTLPEEGGASLKAAGFILDKESAGNTHKAWHNRPGRKVEAVGDDLVGGKWRWAA
jgi:hypothetical protein